VLRAVLLDMGDGAVDAVHHLHGDDGVEIFGRPVLGGGLLDARVGLLRGCIAAAGSDKRSAVADRNPCPIEGVSLAG
jgi:hypothetical protein